MEFKCKVTADDITYGPPFDRDLNDVEAFLVAGELMHKGYRGISNAYCIVSRIDNEQWIDILATKLGCCVADFYNKDGSGISDQWRDHYIRSYSKDRQTVHPAIYKRLKHY